MRSLLFRRASRGSLIALFILIMPLSFAGSLCGNGMIDIQFQEGCDDGNTDSGDGCSRFCQVENGWECTAPYLALAPLNLVQDPGFEGGDANTPWENGSSTEPVICNVETCPREIGSRQGAWWAQLGGVPNQTWAIKQAVDNAGSINQPYWLKFNVMNALCTNESPDYFSVLLDGQPVWTTTGADPACAQSQADRKYREILVDISNLYPVGSQPETITLEMDSGSSNFIVATDEFHIGPAAAPPVPSVCTLETNVRSYQDFDGIGGVLEPPDFEQFILGEFGLKWGTTDDGSCGSFQNPPGNHTGEPGAAACIDSSQFLQQRQQGGTFFIESYFCQAPIDLTNYIGSTLQLTVNYQPGQTTAQDFFGVWVDNQPFMGPLAAGIDIATFLTNNPQGQFGQPPGIPYTFEVPQVDRTSPVFICFGYGNDGAGYAQVDTVVLRNENCIDDFEEDKLGSCVDNCALIANPDQTDSDNDGYGNACDADIALNATTTRSTTPNGNDCVVNFQDLVTLADAFLSQPGFSNWNPDADFNDDDVVNFLDVSIFSSQFLQAPGPSGITGVCGVGGGA